MRKSEWILTLLISGLGMMVANRIGFDTAFSESLPGVLILLALSVVAVFLSWLIPVKLPTVAYCSILGLLVACPLSPVASFVISSVNAINFTAPLTMVGAFAGMSISNKLRIFFRQGWKLILISFFVMMGTFFGSLIIGEVILSATGVI